jgi:hypothetical protein
MQNKLKPRQSEHYKKNTDMQVGRHLKWLKHEKQFKSRYYSWTELK